jgi:DNA (cytosine-5)-methyltransferase 1
VVVIVGKLLGWRTVCAVERDAYAAQVLAKRQNDGILEPFPIWSDVCSFDGKPWRGIVDVVSGGFPCQDISIAGRGAGIEGKRSGLWKEFARIIGEVRPSYAFIENSPMLVIRGLETVLCDLAAMGYYAKWGYFDAETCGSNHQRGRTFILATDSNSAQCKGRKLSSGEDQEHTDSWRVSWWEAEPAIHRVDDGVAHRMDRLKAIGNGQVPIVAATAFQCLTNQK